MVRTLALVPVVLALMACWGFATPVAYVSNISRAHFRARGTEVWVTDDASGEATNVSEGLDAAVSPAWAPDGSRLAFQAIEDTYSDIFVCDRDGQNRQNLTGGSDSFDTMPAFVGDRDTLVYLSGPDRTHIFLLDLRSGAKKQLTQKACFYEHPVPLPDGSGVIVTGLDKLRGAGDIYLVTLDGTVTNLTEAPALYSRPAISPDGKTVAFCYDRRDIGGATRGLAIMPLHGGEPTLLARDGYPLATVCYSPDGSKIAYTSSSHYNTTWIHLINADGSEPRRLDVEVYHIISWPSFSPDGQSLAYHGVWAAIFTIHVVDLATGEDVKLGAGNQTGVRPVFAPK